jgi:hypothetical protein
MGKMKEYYMDVTTFAEDCCGTALTEREARLMFFALYPEETEVFADAWKRWESFAEEVLEFNL